MKEEIYVTPIPFGPLRSYLSYKKYKVICYEESRDFGLFFHILSDSGFVIACLLRDCSHLDGGRWVKV